jgi:hypothetical protein
MQIAVTGADPLETKAKSAFFSLLKEARSGCHWPWVAEQFLRASATGWSARRHDRIPGFRPQALSET